MWLLDRFFGGESSQALLHVGAKAARWHVLRKGQWNDPIECIMVADGVAGVSDLRSGLGRIQEDGVIDPATPCRVLLDSHWASVCWLQAGGQPFAPKSFLTLAAHRFSRLYGGAPASWHVVSPYLVGDQAAMAFGLPEAVSATLRSAFSGRIEVDSVLHVAQRFRTQMLRRERTRISHLCLLEDDRMLIQTWSHRKLLGCHPCVDLPMDMDDLLSQVRTERIRLSDMHGVELPSERAFVEVFSVRPSVHWRLQAVETVVGEEQVTVRTGVSELFRRAKL